MRVTIEGPIDIDIATSYEKGYKVRMTDIEGSWTDYFVFDGDSWLWYGNQRWLEIPEEHLSFAHMQIYFQGDPLIETGFCLDTDDDYNYAYDRGVRSLIYTGPGLPAGGVVMGHLYPRNDFGIYGPNGLSVQNVNYIFTDDTVLGSIVDNSEYTVRLYEETAAVVSLDKSTPVQTYTFTNPKRPYLNSELSASMFPTLITPKDQNLASLNIGGEIPVAWNPSPAFVVDHVKLWWSDVNGTDYETKSYLLTTATSEPTTSTTLDTKDLPPANGRAYLFMWGEDKNGRGHLSTNWHFGDDTATTYPGTTPTPDPGFTPTELVCGYESGWVDTAAGGEPITPNSFADYETVVTDCGTALPFTVANVAGSTFASDSEMNTFNNSANDGTANDPKTGVYQEGSETFNFTWYIEDATCTNCTHSYLVIYSDKTVDPNLPIDWLRETYALTGEVGSSYSFVIYNEQSNFSDTYRSTGADGEIWSITRVKQQ